MKSLIYTLTFALLGVVSCDRTDNYPPNNYDYTVYNVTDKTVKIIPVYGSSLDFTKQITISPNTKYQKNFSDKAPYDGYSMSRMLFGVDVDKAIIVFNNERKIEFKNCDGTFNCNSEPRNIFNHIFNNELQETYTITNDDYYNSTSCNGDCF